MTRLPEKGKLCQFHYQTLPTKIEIANITFTDRSLLIKVNMTQRLTCTRSNMKPEDLNRSLKH